MKPSWTAWDELYASEATHGSHLMSESTPSSCPPVPPPSSPNLVSPLDQPRRRRIRASTAIAAVLAAILVTLATVLVLNHGALPAPLGPTGNPVFISIDGVDRVVTYRGNWSGYFGPTLNDTCRFCPLAAEAGSAVEIPLFTLDGPKNLTYTVYYNISGPFLMQATFCSGANCVFPWVHQVTSFFYAASPGLNVTIREAFLMPGQPPVGPNIIQFNATICPTSICPQPTP